MNNLKDLLIEQGYFSDLKQYVIHNYQIAEFYENMFMETGEEVFLGKSKSINLCCKYFDLDYFRLQAVKNIKRVNLCHDKFCFNCQSVISLSRQSKFAPFLNKFRKDYKVCHMVLTVPNCYGEELELLLDKMYDKFPYLMRYFKLKRSKVAGIDFLKYGYGGSVRGLECTYNRKTFLYHPHFHCMVLFRKDLDLEGKFINSFSYDRGVKVRDFSELEILIQKIWYLLMNDIKVTKKNIEELKEGYSCFIEDSEGHYHEVFKYAIKGAFDKSEGAYIYKESIFKILYKALYKRRMIQGYGVLYKIKDENEVYIDEVILNEYEKALYKLYELESPEFVVESLEEVIDYSKQNIRYMSKNMLKRSLNWDEVLKSAKELKKDDEEFEF